MRALIFTLICVTCPAGAHGLRLTQMLEEKPATTAKSLTPDDAAWWEQNAKYFARFPGMKDPSHPDIDNDGFIPPEKLKDLPLPEDDGSAIFHLRDYAGRFSVDPGNVVREDLHWKEEPNTGLRDYTNRAKTTQSLYNDNPIFQKYYGYGRKGSWLHGGGNLTGRRSCGDDSLTFSTQMAASHKRILQTVTSALWDSLRDLSNFRILEIAPGLAEPTSRFLHAEAKQREKGLPQMYICDLSPSQLSLAIDAFVTENISATAFICDGMNLPVKDNSFDLIVHLGSLNAFPSPATALEGYLHALKPGGTAVVSDEHYQNSDPETTAWQQAYAYYARPQTLFQVPIEAIPKDAVNTDIKFINKCFYSMAFQKRQVM